MSDKDISMIKNCFPTGTKVGIISCSNPNVPVGATGSVKDIDIDGTINVMIDGNGPVKIKFGFDLIKVL